jgi:uncharacterized protein involved in exopolysaccharide biosynthesis
MAQNNTLTIGEFWKECLAKWRWFCYSVVIIMLFAIIYLVVTPPKYTRKAQVLIKEENGMGALMGQLGGLAELGGLIGLNMGSANVYNELYAMQSPWLLLNVIHQLHLDMSYTIKGIRNKDLYAETQPVIVDFKDITEEDDVRMKIDLNKNGNVRIYKFKKNDDTFDDDLTGKVGQTFKTSIGNVEIKATPYLSKMEDDEVTITVNRIEPMELVDQIKKKRLNIVVGSRDASIIDIKYKDVSKKRATDVINAIIAEYRKELTEERDREMAVSEQYVIERLASLQTELKTLDQRVADYKSKTMVPDLEVMAKVYAEGAKDISQAHLEVSNRLYMAQAIRDYLRDESKKDELLPALLVADNKGLADQLLEYNKLQIQRQKIIASSNKNNPFVADIDKQLSAMHDAVLVSAENAIKQLKMQLKTVTDMEEKGKQMISSAPKKYIGGLTDERDWCVLNEVYVFLLQKREEAQMSKALRTDIRILTPPLGVKEQSSPVKKNVIAGAFLLGLFLPAAAIFIRERKRRES